MADPLYINYARPEQTARPFDEQDVHYLLQSLDNDIRALEGKREVSSRNYLDFTDSIALNRAYLTKMIILQWLEKR